MGRLISHAARCSDPEMFLISISKGTDRFFGREYHGLAQCLIGQFKREKGTFVNPSCFARIKVPPYIGGDVIPFRAKSALEPADAADVFWTRFYATLLGIEIKPSVVEIGSTRENSSASVTVLKPARGRKRRQYA